MALGQLATLCKEIGRAIPRWIQGPGGNISYKDDKCVWIKASGFRLSDVTATTGIAKLHYQAFTQDLSALIADAAPGAAEKEKSYAHLVQLHAIDKEKFGRPSMEVGFHAVLAQPFVAHFHALTALLMAHLKETDESTFNAWLTEENLADDITVIPLLQPGFELAEVVAQEPNSGIYILANHGVILQGPGSTDILERWRKLEDSFLRKFADLPHLELLTQTAADLLSLCQHKSFPIRVYLPDFAILYDDIVKILITDAENPNCYFLAPHAENSLNAMENWLASVLLQQFCPDLAELPLLLQSKIRNLPLEKLRMQQIAKTTAASTRDLA